MKLSIHKCSQMTFTRKRQPISFAYSIGGVKLKKEEVVKYLGVQFSHNLSWSAHIDYVTAKANRMLNFLKRNFRDCPQTAKATLFKTNVRPILEYASVLWDPKESYLGKKIEQVQSRAARFVTRNYNYRESATALKRQLEWEPLSSRRRRLRLKFLHAIYHDQTGINKVKFIQPPNFVSRRLDHSEKNQGNDSPNQPSEIFIFSEHY